jgi:hypothetical protein
LWELVPFPPAFELPPPAFELPPELPWLWPDEPWPVPFELPLLVPVLVDALDEEPFCLEFPTDAACDRLPAPADLPAE